MKKYLAPVNRDSVSLKVSKIERMTALNISKRTVLISALLIGLISAMLLISQSTFFTLFPSELSLGITLDLVITMPLLYFLIIRKTSISNTTIIPIIAVGLWSTFFILPKEQHHFINFFKLWILPFAEVGIATFIVLKVRKLRKNMSEERKNHSDFIQLFRNASKSIFPKKLIPLLVSEAGMIYYGFIAWRKKPLANGQFSYHKNNTENAMIYGFMLLIFVELFGLHFLLASWSIIAAWILTVLSTYSLLEVWGIARSLRKRPISIIDNQLNLRFGLVSEVDIDITNIQEIRINKKTIDKEDGYLHLGLIPDAETPNILIHLEDTVEVLRIYGFHKQTNKIALFVDEPAKFLEYLEQKSQS